MAYWLLIKQLYLIYLEKQISFIPFMSKKKDYDTASFLLHSLIDEEDE